MNSLSLLNNSISETDFSILDSETIKQEKQSSTSIPSDILEDFFCADNGPSMLDQTTSEPDLFCDRFFKKNFSEPEIPLVFHEDILPIFDKTEECTYVQTMRMPFPERTRLEKGSRRKKRKKREESSEMVTHNSMSTASSPGSVSSSLSSSSASFFPSTVPFTCNPVTPIQPIPAIPIQAICERAIIICKNCNKNRPANRPDPKNKKSNIRICSTCCKKRYEDILAEKLQNTNCPLCNKSGKLIKIWKKDPLNELSYICNRCYRDNLPVANLFLA